MRNKFTNLFKNNEMKNSDPCTVSSYLFVRIKSYKYTLSIITSFRLGASLSRANHLA